MSRKALHLRLPLHRRVPGGSGPTEVGATGAWPARSSSDRFIETNPRLGILTTADFDTLASSDKLFARRFDERVDSTILDLLDAHIDQGSARVAG